jgi:hypothetical protein
MARSVFWVPPDWIVASSSIAQVDATTSILPFSPDTKRTLTDATAAVHTLHTRPTRRCKQKQCFR